MKKLGMAATMSTFTSIDNPNLLSEYEAAVRVGMSPTLLRWLTKYAPKSGDARKLKVAQNTQDTLFFDED